MLDLYIVRNILSALDISDFNKRHLQKDIQDYINKQYDKLKLTKNAIFRNEPVNFFEYYIPLTLTNNSNNIRVSDPLSLISKYKKIGVIGSAGSGKTTLLRYVALNSIKQDFAIPVIIDLRNFNAFSGNFEKYVCEQISESEYLQELFKKDKFIFIFDGYDEIDYVSGSSIIKQIERFIFKYSENYFLISSRPGTNVESLSPFFIFSISPLNHHEISLFLEKIDIPDFAKRQILLNINEDKSISELLSNPLLLSLFISTYYRIRSDIPNKKSVFLRIVIDSLFTQHDSISKLGYVREKISGLSKDILEEISSILAFRFLFSSKYQMSKDELYKEFELIKKTNTLFRFENDSLLFDLTITVNIIQEVSNYFSFPHILIVEYLASVFIVNLANPNKIAFYERVSMKENYIFSSSLLGFLYELDYLFLLKYFLVPNLENLYSRISYYYSNNDKLDRNIDNVIIQFIRENKDLSVVFNSDNLNLKDNIGNVADFLKQRVSNVMLENENDLFDILN